MTLSKIKILIYSIRGMNKESYFTTPAGWIKYEEDTIQFQEDGINPFDRPFKYAKYEEKKIEFKEDGKNPFAESFKYLKYGERKYLD